MIAMGKWFLGMALIGFVALVVAVLALVTVIPLTSERQLDLAFERVDAARSFFLRQVRLVLPRLMGLLSEAPQHRASRLEPWSWATPKN